MTKTVLMQWDGGSRVALAALAEQNYRPHTPARRQCPQKSPLPSRQQLLSGVDAHRHYVLPWLQELLHLWMTLWKEVRPSQDVLAILLKAAPFLFVALL